MVLHLLDGVFSVVGGGGGKQHQSTRMKEILSELQKAIQDGIQSKVFFIFPSFSFFLVNIFIYLFYLGSSN